MRKFLVGVAVLMIAVSSFAVTVTGGGGGGGGTGDMLGSNNLSDVDSAATSATNLGLGTGSSVTITNLTLSGGVTANNVSTNIVTFGDGTSQTTAATGGGSATVTQSVQFNFAGEVAGVATNNMLRDYALTAFEWNMGPARIVSWRGFARRIDSGGVQLVNNPEFALRIDGVSVATINIAQGGALAWSATTNIKSAVLVDGSIVEVGNDGGGTNNDMIDFTGQMTTTANAN